MKTLVLSMISIAATVAAMTACTSESDPINDITNPKDAKVEIKLNAGVIGVETKAAITQDEGISAFNNATVPLFRMDGSADPTWADVTSTVNATINGTTVTLGQNQQYYPNEGNAYFIGYYSELTPTTTKNVLAFAEVDGTKDIICTNQTNAGSKVLPTSNAKLIFNHMLSKVEIKVVGTAASVAAFGDITKVELLDMPTSLDLTLDKTSSIVANADSPKPAIVLHEGTKAIPTTSSETIGVIPMIFNGGESSPYGTNANPLKIKVTTSIGGVFDIDVKSITSGLENGKKHTITLTFKDKIGVSTEITPWGDSTNSGSEDVG